MILRRAGLNPLCRQCGHELCTPTTRCPMCGMRTGHAEPLRPSLRGIADRAQNDEHPVYEELDDRDPGEEEIVVGPPVERLPPSIPPIAMHIERDADPEVERQSAPVARNVSLRSLMLGTLLIAACLGLGRVSPLSGILAFLIVIPAYVRTLSAISYYRQAERELGREDVATIFATSLVLALMGLSGGGLVFLAMTFVAGLIVHATGMEDPIKATTVLGVAAAFVTVLVLIHKVWPVNED